MSSFGTFPGGWVGGGGWVESIIRLISAEAEAEALICLAELGNIYKYYWWKAFLEETQLMMMNWP